MIETLHISAAPGQPSTFWKSKSGVFYRTKAEAEKDSGTPVNPDDYKVGTNFFVKYKKYIIAACISALVAGGLVYYFTKIKH